MARSIHSTVKGSRLLDALDRERLLRGKSCAPPLNSRQDKMPHGGGNITIMAWRSFLIFGDIEGKLDVLCVECTKCARKRRYNVRRLIEKYGRKANMMKWKEQLNGDCPRRDAHGLHERCDLICPDLPKVLLKDGSA
jgi:hypothetical protein